MRRLKNRIIDGLAVLLPERVARFRAIRNRNISHGVMDREGMQGLTKKLLARFGDRVLDGPFKGIRFPEFTHRENVGPFLLGTYEAELFPIWERIFKSGFEPAQCLDIGALFGFYAVAMKQQFPEAEVIAFDPDPWAQQATAEMAGSNNVDIRVESLCNPAWLENHCKPGSLILSDCEGYEKTLFGTSRPVLKEAVLLIELHPHIYPEVEESITLAFENTHWIERVPLAITPPAVSLDFLTEKEQGLLLANWRSDDQLFLFIYPKTRRF